MAVLHLVRRADVDDLQWLPTVEPLGELLRFDLWERVTRHCRAIATPSRAAAAFCANGKFARSLNAVKLASTRPSTGPTTRKRYPVATFAPARANPFPPVCSRYLILPPAAA